MKTDLTTSIIAAIIGVVLAYLLCSILLPEIEAATIKTLSSSPDYNLKDPDVNVFNYRALNPTVEVYVGNCKKYNENNECIDNIDSAPTEEEEQNGASD